MRRPNGVWENAKPRFSIIEAPSILGLKPSGVEHLPEALKRAGLYKALSAEYARRVEPLPYSPERDKETRLLNPSSIRIFSLRLADVVGSVLGNDRFPVVLGGDCSIILGNLLALRRIGRYGLCFIDGHADFYQPEASPTGEAADMDLALASGRGPDVVTNIDGLKPLVCDEDAVVFGFRDAEEAARYGSQDVHATGMHVFDLSYIRSVGINSAAQRAVDHLTRDTLAGFWIHIDADVLDDTIMPAVDYRLEGGLTFDELSSTLQILLAPGKAVGIDVTIFNPMLDPDGSIARELTHSIVNGLKPYLEETALRPK
ncbi:MAG TPA: arginase family protein [Anaerolineae bacterium]|jgi:arginase|nr:arginase family protein [Anaerolineae bacterium]